jgi:hypothetical protein
MNTILHALSALLSGAFLNLGLERLAERFDPLTGSSGVVLPSEMNMAMPCIGCNAPADFAVGN